MPRKRTPFIRPDANRDARLIVIATEDTKAAVKYFETLVSPAYYQNSKVHVEILTRTDTASSPDRVLAQLNKWIQEYQIADEDELWLVIDVDQWGEQKLSQVAQECHQKQIQLAVSNPAIELWFLLHLVDLAAYDEIIKQEFLVNAKGNSRRSRLEQEIITLVGRYNKSNLQTDDFLPHVEQASLRAEQLDIQPQDRWPQQLGTHVYRLVRSIVDSTSYR